MSGCIWKFSDQIDDVDVEMLRRDFITFREAMEYYGLNEKPVVRLARVYRQTGDFLRNVLTGGY